MLSKCPHRAHREVSGCVLVLFRKCKHFIFWFLTSARLLRARQCVWQNVGGFVCKLAEKPPQAQAARQEDRNAFSESVGSAEPWSATTSRRVSRRFRSFNVEPAWRWRPRLIQWIALNPSHVCLFLKSVLFCWHRAPLPDTWTRRWHEPEPRTDPPALHPSAQLIIYKYI